MHVKIATHTSKILHIRYFIRILYQYPMYEGYNMIFRVRKVNLKIKITGYRLNIFKNFKKR